MINKSSAITLRAEHLPTPIRRLSLRKFHRCGRKETICGSKTVKPVKREGQRSSQWHSRDTAGRELGLQAKKQRISSLITRHFNMYMYINVMLTISVTYVTSFWPMMLRRATPNVTMQQRGALFPQFSSNSNPVVSAVLHAASLSALPYSSEGATGQKYSLASFTNTTQNQWWCSR